MVRQGQFREDLYYRMSTINLEIPPLRQRGSDVELLTRHFVSAMNERFCSSKRISDAALAVLRRHTWPGNVRELLHAVEAAMVVCEGAEILAEHLPPTVRTPALNSFSNERGDGPGKLPTLDELERNHIRMALEASDGHRANAANILGISERNLYRKLRELGLLP
jgi:DNA-binding NtrC family response regulator